MIPQWAFDQADVLLAEVVAINRLWGDELASFRLKLAEALNAAMWRGRSSK